MHYLVTGAESCSGQHLTRALSSRPGVDILGIGRSETGPENADWDYQACDVSDATQVDHLIRMHQPAALIHLAASTDESDLDSLINTNIGGTLNLLRACHRHGAGSGGILLIGSAGGFGEMESAEAALGEERLSRPDSFYGWSREAHLELGRVAHQKWGLPVYTCRPFNLIGPGLKEAYAPCRLAQRLIESKDSGETHFPLWNAMAVRDFVDVRDAAAAYLAILKHGKPVTPYSIGRGIGVTMQELVETMAETLGISVQIEPIEEDAESSRTGIQRSIADIARIRRDTGWEPQRSLRESIEGMMEILLSPSNPTIQAN